MLIIKALISININELRRKSYGIDPIRHLNNTVPNIESKFNLGA